MAANWLAPALGGVAVAASVHRLVASTPDPSPYLAALLSPYMSIGRDGKRARAMPVKWEDVLYSVLLASLAWLLQAVAVTVLRRGEGAPPPAAPPATGAPVPRTRMALLLHAIWLATQAALEVWDRSHFSAKWLCTWSWWATGLYAVLALATANHAHAPAALPVVAVQLPCTLGLIFWTHISYLRALHLEWDEAALHVAPLLYLALAVVLDRPPTPPAPAAARRAALLAALGPIVVVASYAFVFDYRELYSAFFELFGVSSWWPSLEMALMSATAGVLARALYGPPAPLRARLWPVLVIALAGFAPSLAVMWLQPVRFHHLRNCPPAPMLLARVTDHGLMDLTPAGVALLAGPDLVPPLYVHAIVGSRNDGPTPPSGRLLADRYLQELVLAPPLVSLCPAPVVVPAPGELWLRIIPVPLTSRDFRDRVLSVNQLASRTGTLLLLYADGVASTEAATAVALAPSVVVHLDGTLDATAARRLGALTAAAQAHAARPACAAARLYNPATVLNPDPHAHPSLNEAMLPSPSSTLGRLVLVPDRPDRAAAPYWGFEMTPALGALLAAATDPAAAPPTWPNVYASVDMTELGAAQPDADGPAYALAARTAFVRADDVPFVLRQVAGMLPAVPGMNPVATLQRALTCVSAPDDAP
jgi:hypothetical protein